MITDKPDKLIKLRCCWLKHQLQIKYWQNQRNICYEYELKCTKCNIEQKGFIFNKYTISENDWYKRKKIVNLIKEEWYEN